MTDSEGNLTSDECKDIDNALGVDFREYKDQLAAARAAEKTASDLLRSPSIFVEFVQDVRKGGLVGESQNALALFVMICSRLLEKPLSVLVKGSNAVGKDFFVKSVLKFLPRECFQEISSISGLTLNYMSESELVHRVLYFCDGRNRSGHSVRLLLSERKLHHLYIRPGKWKITNDLVTSGPVVSISTTTEDWLGLDQESLYLSLWLDESSPQTKAIAKAYVAKSSEKLDPARLLGWIYVQKALETRRELPIEIPDWFLGLVDLIPTSDVRIRRYWPAFVEACRTVSLIRSFRWDDDQLKGRGGIRITFSDFAITNLIFDDIFVNSLTRNAKDEDVKTAEMVKRVTNANSLANGVAANDLMGEPGVTSIDKAYRLLHSAERAGTIVRLNASLKNNQKLYAAAPEIDFLGSPELAHKHIGSGKPVEFVHPITGAKVRYGPTKK